MTPHEVINAHRHLLVSTERQNPIYINPYGLPMPLCKAIEWQGKAHSKGKANISVTSLIDAPLQFFLKRILMALVVVEYSDRLWALYGTIAHTILEKAVGEAAGQLRELRMFAEIGGWTVSGQMDLWEEPEAMTDYKFTSTYNVLEGVRREWINQENTYFTLMRHSKDPELEGVSDRLQRLQICAMLRDHGPRHLAKLPSKTKVLEVPVWPAEEADDYVLERVAIHREAEENAIADPEYIPPRCDVDERWTRAPTFAVMKRGNKRAKKVCGTRGEAEAWITEQAKPGELYIDERPGEEPRCELYCDFSRCGLCPYYKCKKPPVAIKHIAEALPVKTDWLTLEVAQ